MPSTHNVNECSGRQLPPHLHGSTDERGAHYSDLLDIQKVLDHAEPATTMWSCLDPMDTGVKERAARFLD